MGFFEKLKAGLSKTRKNVFAGAGYVFRGFTNIDDDFYEDLLDSLILADVGMEASEDIIEKLKAKIKEEKIKDGPAAKEALKAIMADMLEDSNQLHLDTKPSSILVIGVNGVGKTTSVAKIASLLKNEGKDVILAAADTFRAAAVDQLEVWAKRVGVKLIKQAEGADPAAVVFDAAASARKNNADVLMVDTAGRLHNKKNLMDELSKINRVIERELPGSSRESLLVLDATTGRNAVNQAKEFKNVTDITGIVLTKLDGTAKGGVVFSLKKELDIPVKYIGVGEGVEDLQPFNSREFVEALFDDEENEG